MKEKATKFYNNIAGFIEKFIKKGEYTIVKIIMLVILAVVFSAVCEYTIFRAWYPEFISKDSLTQHVGGKAKEGFKKVEHKIPLLSMQDIFSIDEILDYVNKIRERAKAENIENNNFVVETKIDGLTAALEYKNGEFVRGSTRGNGLIGEDVTENLKTIKNIPKKLKENIDITVRGEVFISKADFEKMNQEREENEEELFANARNAAHIGNLISKTCLSSRTELAVRAVSSGLIIPANV